jgi:hypothetical protein
MAENKQNKNLIKHMEHFDEVRKFGIIDEGLLHA